MSSLNNWTALAMRVSICIGLSALIIGIIVDWQDVQYLGLGLVICSPLVGLFASLVSLLYERDWRWAAIAVVLVAIVVARAIASLLRPDYPVVAHRRVALAGDRFGIDPDHGGAGDP